jgi:hypothetical protein
MESYRLSLIKKLRILSPMLQKREQAPACGSNEEEKKSIMKMSGKEHSSIDLIERVVKVGTTILLCAQ